MQIELLDFVSVPARDPARTIRWYVEVLGLSSSDYTPHEVETQNLTLSFWNPEEQGESFVPNQNGIALRVAEYVAMSNVASIRVLEKCGFVEVGEHAGDDGTEELLLELQA